MMLHLSAKRKCPQSDISRRYHKTRWSYCKSGSTQYTGRVSVGRRHRFRWLTGQASSFKLRVRLGGAGAGERQAMNAAGREKWHSVDLREAWTRLHHPERRRQAAPAHPSCTATAAISRCPQAVREKFSTEPQGGMMTYAIVTEGGNGL